MQFHYNYPHYYLPLERNQDDWRVGRKRLPLEYAVGLPLEPMVGLPLEPMVGLPLEPMLVIPQELMELLPRDILLKQREVTGLVAPWY